jgi:hypothetical protein
MPRAPKGTRSTCTVDGCDKVVASHGYCSTHWSRIKRNGTLDVTVLRGVPDIDRYRQKVDERGPDECWPWLGGVNPSGHAVFTWDLPDGTRGQLAHRFGYEHHHGPIPEGQHIDHTCHDPRTCAEGTACSHRSCQNPAHWAAVAPLANTAPDRRRTNADRTHCQRGHEFTPENTYTYMRDGKERRQCRACARDRKAKGPVGSGPGRPRQTHCQRGHEFTPENTYEHVVNGRPIRECRTCRAAAMERYAQRQKG